MANTFSRVGIIGSADVGQTLAKAFHTEGYDVMIGTRNTSKPEVVKFKEDNAAIQSGTFEQAASFGELLVLCPAGHAAEDVVRMAGLHNFKHKIIIDTTNPSSQEPPVNGVLQFFTDINSSLLEALQHLLPDAHLVKAFNSVGAALMYKPSFSGTQPTMFIAGNDANAKATVTNILTTFGWETEDMGKAEAARAIEPLAMLWCIPGFQKNEWTHAFKLLKQ